MTTQVSCACGKVVCAATGAPILTAVCYCDDCQRAAQQIGVLSNSPPMIDADGGTAYVLYRKDRFKCVRGQELLRDIRLKDGSPTRRVVAGCCNAAMYLDFQKGHWVSVYRARIQGVAPPIQMLIQTRFMPQPGQAPRDIPAYRAFPPKFFVKLLLARIRMVFS